MPLITTLANAGARGFGFSGVGAPSAPTIGTATASSTTSATVNYTAPSSDGGSPIVSYTAVASPGGQTATVYRSGSGSISISGLSPGTTYQFRVYASNAYGSSPYSGYSNSVTTQSPFAVSVSPRTGSANIAKVSTAITSYGSFTVTATGGSGTVKVQETSRPTGGSTTISPSSFTLSAGQSQVVNVSCTSPTGNYTNTEYYYDFYVDAFGYNPSYTFTQYRS